MRTKIAKVTVTFHVRISPELNQKIEDEADFKGESKTALFERVMEQYFKGKEENN